MNFRGNTMLAPTFANIETSGKFSLKDLIVTGYDKSEYDGEAWDGGVFGGNVVLQTLTKGGVIDLQCYWCDYIEGEDEDPSGDDYYCAAPGWYKYVAGDYIKLTDAELAEYTFDQGQAFWMKSTLTKAVQLQPVGQVGKDDIEFTLNTRGNTAVGNASPVPLTLGDLTVTGYTESEYDGEAWDGGVFGGNVVLQTLTKGGVIDQQYYWCDYTEGEDEDPQGEDYYKAEAGWYKYVAGDYVKLTKQELDEVEVVAGQGYWLKSTLTQTTVKLVVPGVEL